MWVSLAFGVALLYGSAMLVAYRMGFIGGRKDDTEES